MKTLIGLFRLSVIVPDTITMSFIEAFETLTYEILHKMFDLYMAFIDEVQQHTPPDQLEEYRAHFNSLVNRLWSCGLLRQRRQMTITNYTATKITLLFKDEGWPVHHRYQGRLLNLQCLAADAISDALARHMTDSEREHFWNSEEVHPKVAALPLPKILQEFVQRE